MIEDILLPQELTTAIGSECKDFAVKANRAQPLKKALASIAFGIAWTAFTSIFVFVLIVPVLMGKEVHFKLNGAPTVAGPGNLGPIIIPAIATGIFVLIGIGILGYGLYSLFKKGGYFVGTPIRLVHYQNGKIRSIDWEQFSGDIEVSGTVQNGNISLHMRTGRMVSKKNSPDQYVPDVIYIAGAPNVFEIEQLCRKRIKENDPTPPITERETA